MEFFPELAIPAFFMLIFFILGLAVQLLFLFAAIKVLTISKQLKETNYILRELVETQRRSELS